LLCLISIPNSQVTHTESMQKYTEVVILAHYSPLKALTAVCHAWSPAEPPTPPHALNRSVTNLKWRMLASYPPTLQKERGLKIVTSPSSPFDYRRPRP
jgi:hypothetical protein